MQEFFALDLHVLFHYFLSSFKADRFILCTRTLNSLMQAHDIVYNLELR
jgi:hypothetical protein